MKKTNQEERAHYSRDFKHSVIKEYLSGGVSKYSLQKKYGIKMHSPLNRWMRELGYLDNEQKAGYSSPSKAFPLPSKKVNKDQLPAHLSQEQRIKELERLLEDEQLRSEAYRRIIEIAEKDFNIPIRKKPDTR